MSDNRQQLCERMKSSIQFSTKNSIPNILNSYGVSRLLDVGCADGSFTKYIAENTTIPYITGIDCNDAMIEDAKKKNSNNNIQCFINATIDTYLDKDLDAILFSSVLHEISSFDKHADTRYLSHPIADALTRANSMLAKNGIVIIRDMVKAGDCFKNYVEITFKKPDLFNMFINFMQQSPFMNNPCMHHSEYQKCEWNGGNTIKMREDVLLEFLMIATWGKESFDREIQERKFILSKYMWLETLKNAGFEINMWLETNEEYPKYWKNLIYVPENYVFPSTTCLIVAQKKS